MSCCGSSASRHARRLRHGRGYPRARQRRRRAEGDRRGGARADSLGDRVRRYDRSRGDDAAPEMVAVSVDDSPRRVLDVVIAEGYSKLPVYQESKDDIVGVVHDRELLVALANGSLAHTSVRSLMRPAVHVPETKKIAELLREMQRDKFSLAIVVDEYGGTAGLVTMEDLLEEIVGEIRDEHDHDEQEPIAVDLGWRSRRRSGHEHRRRQRAAWARNCRPKISRRSAATRSASSGAFPTEGEEVDAGDHTRLRVDRTRGRRILAVRIYTNGSIAQPQESEDRTPPRAYKTRGIVFRGRQLGEADRIVTLFTRERGKLDAVAKGVRRIAQPSCRAPRARQRVRLRHASRPLARRYRLGGDAQRAMDALVEPERYARRLAGRRTDRCVLRARSRAARSLRAARARHCGRSQPSADPRELLPRFSLRLLEMLGLAPPLGSLRALRRRAAGAGTVWLDAQAGGVDRRRLPRTLARSSRT